ncbi:LysR family transcriptional regulator [Apilactobacillus ozensis]|uniref:LysR family transcriptional regulator n=1 Tax=Apilactobacillus ozensis TaxID=866801 RepID=UPI000A8FDA1B|nr:LysR family transcriptional regulator [Apilactobacillus ozensis]
MNIRDLEYFKNLVEQKNFSKVAAKFKVSQPTITTAIKRLENEFNAKLFIRDRRHNTIEATASGVQLFKHCQTILNELSIAQQELHNITHQKLVLGLPPIIENHYFTQVCSKLAQLNLLKSLTTVEGGSVSLTDSLRKGQLDLSLLGSINPINYTDLTATETDRQPFCIYVSKNIS